MKNVAFFALLGICLVILLAGTYQPQNTKEAIITVGGMHCDNCPKKIQSALTEVKGVQKASVSLEKSAVEITFNPSVVTLDELKGVITEIGYVVDSKTSSSKCPVMNEAETGSSKAGKSHHDGCSQKPESLI